VTGWLHIAQTAHLTADPAAEILGLVVADSARGGGIGADLVRAAEAWAHGHGCDELRVRSRVERERAHRFYERAGYARVKTQAVFGKPVD
jgi:GNAT superfamily N-acetyltransferase